MLCVKTWRLPGSKSTKKKERLAELEEAIDVQRVTLEITHKELAAEMKKAEIFKKEKDQDIKNWVVFVRTTAVHRRQVAGSPKRD